MCALLRSMWSFLRTYDKEISSIAAIVTAGGVVFAALQFQKTVDQVREAKKSLEATTVYQIQKDGRDLLKSLRDDKEVLYYIYHYKKDACYDLKVISRSELAITEIIQYFSSVFNQRRNGVISDAYWDTFSQEICSFVRQEPVSQFWLEKVNKGTYSNEFKAFGNECLKKSGGEAK